MIAKIRTSLVGVLLGCILTAGVAKGAQLSVTSSFKPNQAVPKEHTADGADQSPPLRWSAVPAATKSITIICYDPDAPSGTWYHWIIYNLPGNLTGLGGNVAKAPVIAGGAAQGLNDFGRIGFNGPAPPPGPKHHYIFQIMALDTKLGIKPGARKDEVLAKMKGHVLAQGEIVGLYGR